MSDPRFQLPRKKVIFYSGNQWLSKEAHENLRRYVVEGGTLVAFRDFPRKNEQFEPYQVIGFEDPERTLFEFKKQFMLSLGKRGPTVPVNSSIYVFKAAGCQRFQADLGAYGKQTVGYAKSLGKGRILHFGMEPTAALMLAIMDYLKISLISHSPTKDVKTALFRRGNRYYLVAINNGNEDKNAAVYFPAMDKLKGKMVARDLMNGQKLICSRERRCPMDVHIARKDGRLFEFTPTP